MKTLVIVLMLLLAASIAGQDTPPEDEVGHTLTKQEKARIVREYKGSR